jgi:nucleoside phosphorylase
MARQHGLVDFAIITIREDEYEAVYDKFAPSGTLRKQRRYEVGAVPTAKGGYHRFAIVRCLGQGEAIAQDVTRDVIDDLRPHWILLVGIGGAVPSFDFTLGDVVCATRVHDFSIRAALEGKTDEFTVAGGPMHPQVADLLASLPAIRKRLKAWNSEDTVGSVRPIIKVPRAASDLFYGDSSWRKKVRQSLLHHFKKPQGTASRDPIITAQPVISSDVLVKSTKLLSEWKRAARSVAAVEMELGGVYVAARRKTREYPILAIRGISDIVGFERENAWTKYACRIAAAAAFALVASGEIIEPRRGEVSAPGPGTTPLPSSPTRSSIPALSSLSEMNRSSGKSAEVAIPMQFSALANEYEAIRQRYSPGSARTARMISVAERMLRVANDGPYPAALTSSLFRTKREGYRLAALRLVESRSDTTQLALVLEAIEKPLSAFEQSAALRTTKSLLEKLSASQQQRVRMALLGQMVHARDKYLTPNNSDRWALANQILSRLPESA